MTDQNHVHEFVPQITGEKEEIEACECGETKTLKKITRATIKRFVARQAAAGNLYVNVLSDFDGMVDCVMPLDGGFRKAVGNAGQAPDHTLGFSGIWLVGQSRDGFERYADQDFIGYKVYNSCGSFIVAMRRLV